MPRRGGLLVEVLPGGLRRLGERLLAPASDVQARDDQRRVLDHHQRDDLAVGGEHPGRRVEESLAVAGAVHADQRPLEVLFFLVAGMQGEDRAGGLADQRHRDAGEQQAVRAALAVRGEHHEVGVGVLDQHVDALHDVGVDLDVDRRLRGVEPLLLQELLDVAGVQRAGDQHVPDDELGLPAGRQGVGVAEAGQALLAEVRQGEDGADLHGPNIAP